MTIEIAADRAARFESAKLGKGAHPSIEAGGCVMEWAAYLAGEEHSDSPACASPVIAAFLRRWNDDVDDADREMLRPYAERVIGTASTPEVEDRRALMLCDWLIRHYTPVWLDLAGLGPQATALRQLAEVVDLGSVNAAGPSIEDAIKRASAAYSAALSAARSAALSAADSAAYSAAYSAALSAALSAADSVLEPAVTGLQASALELLKRMIAEGQP